MKKFRVLLLTFVVAIAMMASSLAVFADDSTAPPSVLNEDGTVTMTKVVWGAYGVSDTSTYNFSITPVTEGAAAATLTSDTVETATGSIKVEKAAGEDEALEVGTITFGSGETTGAAAFGHAGKYEYKITETAGDNSDITYDGSEYAMYVYVKNVKDATSGEYSLEIESVTLVKTKDENGDAIAEADQTKQESLEFTNILKKKTTLELSKAVVHPEYAEDTEYTFSVKLTSYDELVSVPTSVTATLYTSASDTVGTEKTIAFTEGVAEVTLKDGERIVFADLDAGLNYQVSETAPAATAGAASFTNAVFEQKDGDTVLKTTTQDSNTIGSYVDEQIVTEGNDNTCAVTNTFEEVTITGIIMNVLPFVMMIVIGAAAAAMYVVSRRRRAAR